ncbi:MAG: response regulator [Deltaproteobacteria bacterium]|nr:response regulator [Deltaproteobacteria bacterium]
MITRAAKGKKVLVVDDEEVIRNICRDVLRSAGYAVAGATDGAEALRKIREEDYDLVVTDVRMPGIDGVALYESAVKECAYLKDRFLFMTGEITEELLLIFSQMNLRYLWKPFKMIDLVNCVDAMTTRARHGGKDSPSCFRKEARVTLQKACDVSTSDERKTTKAHTVDISENGMKVRYKGSPLVRDTTVNISLCLGNMALERRASVVWSRPVSVWDAMTGMRLLEAVSVERLISALATGSAMALN